MRSIFESFNRRFRDKCLNEHWYASLAHARSVIETWRREYSEERPKKQPGSSYQPSENGGNLSHPWALKPNAMKEGDTSLSQ